MSLTRLGPISNLEVIWTLGQILGPGALWPQIQKYLTYNNPFGSKSYLSSYSLWFCSFKFPFKKIGRISTIKGSQCSFRCILFKFMPFWIWYEVAVGISFLSMLSGSWSSCRVFSFDPSRQDSRVLRPLPETLWRGQSPKCRPHQRNRQECSGRECQNRQRKSPIYQCKYIYNGQRDFLIKSTPP